MKNFSRLLTAALAAIISMSSCQTEEMSTPVIDEMTEVSICVNADNMPQTKATPAETIEGFHLRYILEVWTQGSKPERYTRQIQAADANQKATFNLKLLAGRTFDFLLWADYVRDGMAEDLDLHYRTTNNLKSITKCNTLNATDEQTDARFAVTRDAFFAHEAVKVTPSFNKTITLRRAVAQVNVYTTDYLSVPEGFRPDYASVAMPNAPEGFNVLTGQPYGTGVTEPKSNVAVDKTETPGKGYKMYTGYYFTSVSGKALADFDVNFYRYGSSELLTAYKMELIPMQQNYRTNIIGNLLLNEGRLIVETDATFYEPDIEVGTPNDVPAEEGLYYSLDGGAWTEWTSEVMPEGDYTAFAAASVGESAILTLNHQDAVYSNTNLQTIDLGRARVTAFPGYLAKLQRTNLVEFIFPQGVKATPAYMFKGCSNLRSVVLPEGITDLGLGIFEKCI